MRAHSFFELVSIEIYSGVPFFESSNSSSSRLGVVSLMGSSMKEDTIGTLLDHAPIWFSDLNTCPECLLAFGSKFFARKFEVVVCAPDFFSK